jgi:hypothetical protein
MYCDCRDNVQPTSPGVGPQPVSVGGDGTWEKAIVRFLRAVHGNDESCLTCYLGLLGKAKEVWGLVVPGVEVKCRVQC